MVASPTKLASGFSRRREGIVEKRDPGATELIPILLGEMAAGLKWKRPVQFVHERGEFLVFRPDGLTPAVSRHNHSST